MILWLFYGPIFKENIERMPTDFKAKKQREDFAEIRKLLIMIDHVFV